MLATIVVAKTPKCLQKYYAHIELNNVLEMRENITKKPLKKRHTMSLIIWYLKAPLGGGKYELFFQ